MTNQIEIRETSADDIPAVLEFYPQAFPDEDLRPVVSALLALEQGVLSLAAFEGDTLVGHVIFTTCGTEGSPEDGALLAPLGVIPRLQKHGLGKALVRAGFGRLRDRGTAQVFVLGDPSYYQRFGFRPEKNVQPPYPLPAEWADAWQFATLSIRPPLAPGTLTLPTPWMNPALWGP